MGFQYMLFMLAAIFAVIKARYSKIVGISFAIPIAVLQTLQLFIENTSAMVFFHVLAITYLCYVIILVIGYVFEQQRVNAKKINYVGQRQLIMLI